MDYAGEQRKFEYKRKGKEEWRLKSDNREKVKSQKLFEEWELNGLKKNDEK